MTREELLNEAKEIVCKGREEEYGSVERNFELIARMWDLKIKAMLQNHRWITPEDVALLMMDLKVARIITGKVKPDNWVDLIGYAACGGECALRENDKTMQSVW